MSNIMDEAIMSLVYEWDSDEVVFYHQMLKDMLKAHPKYLEAIAQYWGDFIGYGLHDAYVFGNIWHWMFCKGTILFNIYTLEDTPYPDSRTEENNLALSTLPSPLKAKFSGGVGDDDGIIKWDEPIILKAIRLNENQESEGALAKVRPSQVRLEVGYTSAGTTWFHINTHRGLARFPYHQNHVHLWYNIAPFEFLTDDLLHENEEHNTDKDSYDTTLYEFITDWMPMDELPNID